MSQHFFRIAFVLILVGSLCFWSGGAWAEDLDDVPNIQCPGGIVSLGDTRYSVQEKCGKPSVTEDFGEVWVYNYGPMDFVRYITFDEDQVERIQIGGYGSDEKSE